MSLLLSALDARISLKGILGAGGMGEVHRAWDAALQRPVAVKFVRGGDPLEADRLLLEARLQARVEHPHVVRVHDTGTLEGRPCIVLQLVEGRSLAELAEDRDWRTRVALAAQAARGLGAAHRTGLVHRDVKPANILVEDTEDGPMARLSDFGLARGEEGGLTRSGLVVGTLDFMAPEQILGSAPVDFRADIYGLGATLYGALAGSPPFRSAPGVESAPDEDARPAEFLRQLLELDPAPLGEVVPDLPRELTVVVAKAMAKLPAERYATAEALAEDLERVLKGEPIAARMPGLWNRAGRWTRRNPVAARALAASLVAVMGATGYAVMRSRRSALEALDAARVGGEAKALELRLRMAHLAPAHDLRAEHAAIREGLRRLAGQRGVGAAAADYARGRVLLFLDRVDEARAALESARQRGYRGPELDEALGFTYGRIFQRLRQEVEGVAEVELRKERLAVVASQFQKPALDHLRAAGFTPYQQAFAALVEGDYPRCRQMALQAWEQDPVRLDAGLLELEGWVFEAHDAFDDMARDRARGCVEEGLKRGEALRQHLRSDPRVLICLAQLKSIETGLVQLKGEDIQGPFEAGIRYAEEAARLDPDHPDAWVVMGKLLEDACKVATNLGRADGIALGTRQVEAGRRAVALRPEWSGALINLATALYSLGHAKALQGQDPVQDHLEGRQAALRAAALEPWNSRGPHVAALNALDEARYRLGHGTDAAEALQAAEGQLSRLGGMRGMHSNLIRPLTADLRGLQAQQAWNRGQAPDALQAESWRLQDAMRKDDPERLNRTADVGYAAVLWAQTRVAWGGAVSEVHDLASPVLDAGLARWPGQPLLTYYVAWLRTLRLFDRNQGGPSAADPRLVAEAMAAFDQCRKVMPNPSVLEIRAWIHLARAEAGESAAAARACQDFEFMLRRDPASRDLVLGLARALRRRVGPGDLDRAERLLGTLEGPAREEAEALLVQALLAADQGRVAEAASLKARALARQPLLAGHPLLRAPSRPRP